MRGSLVPSVPTEFGTWARAGSLLALGTSRPASAAGVATALAASALGWAGLWSAGVAAGLNSVVPAQSASRMSSAVAVVAAAGGAWAAVAALRPAPAKWAVLATPLSRRASSGAAAATLTLACATCTVVLAAPMASTWPAGSAAWLGHTITVASASAAIGCLAAAGVAAWRVSSRPSAISLILAVAVAVVLLLVAAAGSGALAAGAGLWLTTTMYLPATAVAIAVAGSWWRYDDETSQRTRASRVALTGPKHAAVTVVLLRISRHAQLAGVAIVHCLLVIGLLVHPQGALGVTSVDLLAITASVAGYGSALARGLSTDRPSLEVTRGAHAPSWVLTHVGAFAFLPVAALTAGATLGQISTAHAVSLSVLVVASAAFGVLVGGFVRPRLHDNIRGVMSWLAVALLALAAPTAAARLVETPWAPTVVLAASAVGAVALSITRERSKECP
ncbi:MAG: hypothetical protein ACRCYX_01470 [Dermatophilaceae bacterium]